MGDNWREHIDSSLASILFFIAVITPRYFLSVECRRELQEFARGAERLGIHELILPLVYVNVPALQEESPTDEAVVLVKTYQWVDWRDLRFEDVTSAGYRRAVALLAQRLVDANQRVLAEEPSATQTPEPGEVPGPGDEPGTLDVLASGEEAIAQLGDTLTAIGAEIQRIGALVQQSTEDIRRVDQQGKGFAARLMVSRRLARDLETPAEKILELANNYTSSLYRVDRAMRIIIAQLPIEARGSSEAKLVWDQISAGISGLADVTDQSTALVRGMVASMAPIESVSRDLRPPIQKIRRGLTILTEGSSVINEWKRLVDEATEGDAADVSGEPRPE
jgi:hypothetical protein